MSKAKVSKSAIIRKLHDEGRTPKEIKHYVKCSPALIGIVLRNYKKKKSKIIKDIKEVKQALDEIEKKPKVYKSLDGKVAWVETSDPVNKPSHYTVGGIDFLDYAEAKGLTDNAYLFNVVKYVSRAGRKLGVDPVQDLEKAEFYLKREIERRKSA